jgi:hypothetical protein
MCPSPFNTLGRFYEHFRGVDIMPPQQVPNWTPTILKGELFKKEFAFTDVNGAPIAYTSFVITVTSLADGSTLATWDTGGGFVTFVSTGVYQLLLTAVQTAAISWTQAKYRLSLVDPDSNVIPCLIENLIFARDC